MRPLINVAEESYRDEPEPFVVLIRDGDADEPPSYNELYRQHEMEMEGLGAQLDNEETPAEQTEELVKWVVAMMLICLTVAGVGTAFNWGRDG